MRSYNQLLYVMIELTNFSINQDLISITIDGAYLDLHNNYDFVGIKNGMNSISLQWKKTKGDWVPENCPQKIAIAISDVKWHEIIGVIPPEATLEEMGFFQNSTKHPVDYNGQFQPRENADTWVFRFSGGGELALIGKYAKCLIH